MSQPADSKTVADPKSLVNSILRACKILEMFAAEGGDLSLSRIAEANSLSRPTAHRLLSTLIMAGWVRKTTTGQYGLTMRMFTIGSRAAGASLRDIAHQTVSWLARSTGDTAYLHVPNEGEATCLIRIDGPHPVRVHHVNVGDSIPLLSGAAPLAMAAFQPDLLTKRADQIATRSKPVAQRLAAAREDGFVVSPDNLIVGVTAIGAPVFDRDGIVVGGVAVTGINARYDEEHTKTAASLVRRAAGEISGLLGYSGPAIGDT
jgi:DNA-binding IclR family transcriptional regulator